MGIAQALLSLVGGGEPAASSISVKRLFNNPILHRGMLDPDHAGTVNGPSLIRAPDWLPKRLGRYYLYFSAHKNCSHIHVAVADALEGPWAIHRPGSLRLVDAPACYGTVASPDVHIDDGRRQVRMYFQCISVAEQAPRSFVAVSDDGLHFSPRPEPLGRFYFRAAPWRNMWVGMAKGGVMYRSEDGLSGFERNRRPAFRMRSRNANKPGDVRHVALHVAGDILFVYYTRIGDAPERILRSTINLADPPGKWRARNCEVVLVPEEDWEGADLPVRPSRAGSAKERERTPSAILPFSWNKTGSICYIR